MRKQLFSSKQQSVTYRMQSQAQFPIPWLPAPYFDYISSSLTGTAFLIHAQWKFALKARFSSQFNLVHKSIEYLITVFYMASDNECRPAKNIQLFWKICALCQSVETVSLCHSHCRNTGYQVNVSINKSSVLPIKHLCKENDKSRRVTTSSHH